MWATVRTNFDRVVTPVDSAGLAGALYFTDFGRDQIGRITTSGQITQFNLPVGRGPNQIVAAPDGNLYFTESASSRIGRLPSNALAAGRPTSGNPPLEEFDFIARDDALQQRLVDEIDTAFPGKKDADWVPLNSNLVIMPFLNAVMREVMRVRPTSSTGLERVTPPGGKVIAGMFMPGGVSYILSSRVPHIGADMDTDNREHVNLRPDER